MRTICGERQCADCEWFGYAEIWQDSTGESWVCEGCHSQHDECVPSGAFYFHIEGIGFRWNGSRTVNVYAESGREVNVFSLDYGRDDYTRAQVLTASLEWYETNVEGNAS